MLGSTMGMPTTPLGSAQTFTADLIGGADVEAVTNTPSGSYSNTDDWAASSGDEILAIALETDPSLSGYDFTLKSFTVTYTNRVQHFVLSKY